MGKTRSVWENATTEEDVFVYPGGGWFDGFDNHPIVLFDDFGGSEFKISYLLKLLDRYPLRVPIKGGFVEWNPLEIYITSNLNPNVWYPNAHAEHVAALFRRFTNIVKFEYPNGAYAAPNPAFRLRRSGGLKPPRTPIPNTFFLEIKAWPVVVKAVANTHRSTEPN